MTPYYQDDAVTLHHGNCLDVMRTMLDASIDAVVTDPPYLLSFMGREWDSVVAYQHLDWHRAWCDEAYRLLKPGGHMLAFGGTRTWHRLACAVEDAGFEIRDSIAWLYGSGFPKSLDVSKAIDKRRDWSLVERLAREIRRARAAAGLSLAEVGDATLTSTGGAYGKWYHRGGHMFFETGRSLPSRPEWDHLRHVLPIAPEFAAVYDEAERAVLRETTVDRRDSGWADLRRSGMFQAGERTVSVTAPATPDAERWQGWGTALKPAWESIVVAQKCAPPLGRIGSRLDVLERSCKSSASGAEQSSTPTPHASLEVKADSVLGSAATQHVVEPGAVTATGAAADSRDRTATLPSEWETTTCLNIVTSWRRCWADLCEPTSMSITGTTSSTTTDLTTLWSCLSRITEPSMLLDRTSPDGLSSLARAADSLFAAAVLSLNATRTLTATEPVTSPTHPTSPAAGALEPIVVARKPLSGTVAQNVLTHGTGALNIDACRVEGGERPNIVMNRRVMDTSVVYRGSLDGTTTGSRADGATTAGRWPPNVVLDDSQAAALDEQSGDRRGFATQRHLSPAKPGMFGVGDGIDTAPLHQGHNDQGGASRYFPTFRYEPKADSSQRPRVDGVSHATVKPLDLMRWLVRLVTPPGGLVLDPFAGSGTTAESCIIEGFRCVTIEREPDYLPLILARLTKPIEPVLDFGEAG